MYKANLSHRQLEKYLSFLLSNGMLAQVPEDGTMKFQATEKGLCFLKDYERISNYLKPSTVSPVPAQRVDPAPVARERVEAPRVMA